MFISKPVQFYAEWPPNNFHDENSPGLPVQFLGFVCVNDSISMFHNPTFSCLNHLESPYFFPGKIKSLPFTRPGPWSDSYTLRFEAMSPTTRR
jgi:hypothetical protein